MPTPSMLMSSPVSARPLREQMYTSVAAAWARPSLFQCQRALLWAASRGYSPISCTVMEPPKATLTPSISRSR